MHILLPADSTSGVYAEAILYLANSISAAISELSECVKSITSNVSSELRLLREEISQLNLTAECCNAEPATTNPEVTASDLAHTTEPSTSVPILIFPDPPLHPCGGTPGWRRVTYLNLTDPRYLCPAGWRSHPPPTRGCGRASHDGETCDSAIFPVPGGPYTKICGRVLGYQFGATAAFKASDINHNITINESYVTGVSITHGEPRQHVWTYAAGQFEGVSHHGSNRFCPCERVSPVFIPEFVGAFWYCESGDNNGFGTSGYRLFSNDVLWDGKGCRLSDRCCQFDGPLYFMRTLHEPVSDPIEARICNYRTSQYSDVIVSQFELYVK